MLRVNVTSSRTEGTWKIEIISDNGLVLYSRIAHNLKQLSELLHDASEIVAFAALAESEQV